MESHRVEKFFDDITRESKNKDGQTDYLQVACKLETALKAAINGIDTLDGEYTPINQHLFADDWHERINKPTGDQKNLAE